jgi:spermidine/putrescine-binding protein
MKRWFLALLCLAGCSKPEGPVLRVLTWEGYFAKDTIPSFEKAAGCRVAVDYIESSETLRTKLSGGNSGYDVVVPSDEVVAELVAQGLLEKLDRAKLPGFANLAPEFTGLPYDPKNEHSVPYLWGSTGIAWNKEKIKDPPDSWAALWDPRWANRASMLDDAREVFRAAMRLDGSGDFTPEAVAKAAKRFETWRPLAWESSPKELLIQGDAWIAQCFSGDALQAAAELEGKIGYVIPKEGGTLWIDNLCIAKGTRQPELAHRFIDHLLQPAIAAALSSELRFASPNAAARKLIAKEVLDDPLATPTEEVRKRLGLLPSLSPDRKKVLDEAWARIKRK